MLRDEVLDLLFEEELTQKELTSKLNSSRSRISEVLSRLEKQGFIVRRKVSQRTVVVSLNHSRTLRVGILRSTEYVHVVSTLHELEKKIPFRLKVYDNSLEALKELMTGKEDIIASPLISGYFFFLIDKFIRPIAGVATGGAGLIKRKNHGRIGTTPLSRMDKDSREFRGYEQVYYKSIEDILSAYRKGEIDAAQIWEPFLSMNEGINSPPKGTCCCLFTKGKPNRSTSQFLERYIDSVENGISDARRLEVSGLMSDVLGVRASAVNKSIDSYLFTTLISEKDLENQIASFGLPLVKEVESFLEGCSKVSL